MWAWNVSFWASLLCHSLGLQLTHLQRCRGEVSCVGLQGAACISRRSINPNPNGAVELMSHVPLWCQIPHTGPKKWTGVFLHSMIFVQWEQFTHHMEYLNWNCCLLNKLIGIGSATLPHLRQLANFQNFV